jgi:hypothetical protein
MWWKLTLAILVLMVVCFIGGLYAGAALYLHLAGGNVSTMAWNTLWEAGHLPLSDRRLLYLPWAWCATAAITFLPVGVALMAIFMGLKPKTSLHGDARFATDRELRQFEYVGEYKNTSKK